MTDHEALKLLQGQGHGVGNVVSGQVRIWIHGGAETVDVQSGRELQDLAAGRISFDDILERRDDEAILES